MQIERFLEQYRNDITQFLQSFQDIELLDEKSAHLSYVSLSFFLSFFLLSCFSFFLVFLTIYHSFFLIKLIDAQNFP
jgi:hypothetical protein